MELKNCKITIREEYGIDKLTGNNAVISLKFIDLEVPIPNGRVVFTIPSTKHINDSIVNAYTMFSPEVK